MADVLRDLGMLDQIQSLVLDASQVVSYKWLSRKFSVSSNAAKRILGKFAEANEGDKVEVVYAVCGWSKSEPRTYNVQLVPKVKLQEAKLGFDGSASQHVYSVQPCLPKDPAQLVSAEYVQAQELFMQPRDIDNCLRDNRFSSVSYSHVARGVGGSQSVIKQLKAEPSASAMPPPAKVIPGSITPKAAPQAPQPTPPQAVAQKEAAVKNTVGGAVVKEESAAKSSTTSAIPAKPVAESVATGKKKAGTTGAASSLANLWGKAPAKAKAATPAAAPAVVTGDAEAAIRAAEGDGSGGSSDEEVPDFGRIRRCQAKNGKGRKRQVVMDEDVSDDEEDWNSQVAINLASPEPFRKKTQVKKDAENDSEAEAELQGPTEMEVDEESKVVGNSDSDQAVTIPEEASKPVEPSVGVKREAESGPGASSTPPPGPKRKKVLKTRINDRGKEVTEVVWEVDGVEEVPEVKPALVPDKAPAPPSAPKTAAERPAAPAKAPQKSTAKPPAKGGGRGAASKGQGSGQGSLLSFFKKKP